MGVYPTDPKDLTYILKPDIQLLVPQSLQIQNHKIQVMIILKDKPSNFINLKYEEINILYLLMLFLLFLICLISTRVL